MGDKKDGMFDPTKIKPVTDNLFVQIFISNELTRGKNGSIMKAGDIVPEPYYFVHAVGPDVKTVQAGDYVLVKPSVKGGYEIDGEKYMFIQTYDISAVMPSDYTKYFGSEKTEPLKVKAIVN